MRIGASLTRRNAGATRPPISTPRPLGVARTLSVRHPGRGHAAQPTSLTSMLLPRRSAARAFSAMATRIVSAPTMAVADSASSAAAAKRLLNDGPGNTE
jgi:hypothetical protein